MRTFLGNLKPSSLFTVGKESTKDANKLQVDGEVEDGPA